LENTPRQALDAREVHVVMAVPFGVRLQQRVVSHHQEPRINFAPTFPDVDVFFVDEFVLIWIQIKIVVVVVEG
jgi:hypothetical protein